MKMLIFTEGTVIMHKNGLGHTREEIAEQSRTGTDQTLLDWKSYVPIGRAVEKVNHWKDQGAEIYYLTARDNETDAQTINTVLQKHNFPDGLLLYSHKGEHYKDIAERIQPDILIEDDCVSIGGISEMTYTHIKPEIKKRVKSVSIPEFGGIDHLPDSLEQLQKL